MLNKISKNKVVLEYCVKLASKTTKSKNMLDIFETLVKLAGDYNVIFDSLQSKVNDIIKTPGSSIEDIKRFLNQNLITIAEVMGEMPGSSEAKSNAFSFILGLENPDNKEKWLNYTAKELLNGTQLSISLTKLIRQGGVLVGLKDLSEGKNVHFDDPGLALQIGKDDEYNKEENFTSTEEEIYAIENIFKSVLEDPSQDILSLYIESNLLPEFSKLKNTFVIADNPQSQAEAEQSLREFMSYASNFIKKEFSTNKRDPVKKTTEPFSLLEIQAKVNEAIGNLDLDSLIENILKSNFYSLPKSFKKYYNSNLDFVKNIIKSVIKTSMIITIKDELDVSLPSLSYGRTQNGRAGMKAASILHHIINRQIKSFYKDPKTQEELLHKTIDLLKAKKNPSGEWEYGSGKNFIDYSFMQHATPLVYSGLLNKLTEELGDSFGSLSEQQKNQLVESIYNKVHPHLPHTEFADKYFHNVHRLGKLGPQGEQIIKGNIRKRLENSQKMHRREITEGKLMYPLNDFLPEDDEPTVSSLNILIKKYALKHSING